MIRRRLSLREIEFRAELHAIVQASVDRVSVRVKEILAPLRAKGRSIKPSSTTGGE